MRKSSRFGGVAILVTVLVVSSFFAWTRRPLKNPQRCLTITAPSFSLPAPEAKNPALEATKNVKIAFVGDLGLALGVGSMLARGGAEPGFPFAAVRDELRGYDLLVGNLECVVASKGQPTIPEPLLAPLNTPQILLDAGFDAVSVANNHSLDFSKEGYFDTLARLKAAGLPSFGVTSVDAARSPILVLTVSGIRIALVGHVDRGWQRAKEDIKKARELADVVVVYVHWGVEYALSPVRYQRVEGRAMLDAGADAVIGSHTHVVQPAEFYRGKLIAHGLGNFVFSSMTRQGTHTGALLVLELNKGGIASHHFRQVSIDTRGAPRFVGEPSEEPILDPPGPRPLAPL